MEGELTEEFFYNLVAEITSEMHSDKKWSKITKTKEDNLIIECNGRFIMTGNADYFYKEFDIEMKKQVAELTQQNNGK